MIVKHDKIDDRPHQTVNSSHTLSIEECKKYLGETDLTDKEIMELRDVICSFIDGILDNYFDGLVQ
ncbi:MAG: hypothetical protein COU47_03655 [Candidatus Niyogibacteria bacterium CG10_big_fil_rev_8_21_14_0_10_46_36]|uniref:Uncharacterized protein n=1 Tax=Candidatus Niyogibacteria bacterium CG10_big_fil_rev_8_21_14_0_10_46_36 TaxID=1974726 RepID=A0A2H0TEP9_9BACT|nr:MAG: hypothetical protein COU47_03655 [Candidatus Niyogibacteria bacterium CG10_big_fil_rev_8_21_14_0_10_46_36]